MEPVVDELYEQLLRELADGPPPPTPSGFPLLDADHAEPAPDLCPVGMCVIYALVDPRDGTVRYVGKSVTPGDRYERHLENAQRSNRRLRSWIRTLGRKGRRPDMHLIDMVRDGEWQAAERKWIAHYRAKGRLLNIQPGGVCRRKATKRGRVRWVKVKAA